jgi:predicted nucleic acid-binding protein
VRAYFIDTWAFIALANRRDAGHEVALEVDEFLEAQGWTAVTSDWVLDETVTQLHGLAGDRVTLQFLDDLDAQLKARKLMLLNVSPPRFDAAVQQFRALAPKVPRLSLTDCTTFALMKELEIRWAFTADKHFYAAGPHIGPLVTRFDHGMVFRAPIHTSR